MPVTHDELEKFHRFATGKVESSEADSLQELVAVWVAVQEAQASVAAIRESIAECDAGLDEPFENAIAEIRDRLESSK